LPDVSRVLVCVHGVSRNALEQIQLLKPLAEQYGFVLVAPLFASGTFRDYQRLGRQGLGPRADLALIRILQTIDSTTQLNTGKIALFGFSGGAQFAHRFAYAHSQRVSALVLGAAGWYTMPDPHQSYPFGTADTRRLSAVRFNLRAASRLPTMVAVGSSDNQENDVELNRSPKVLRCQGPHRLARAKTWVDAMNAYASNQGSPGNVQLRVLPGIGHSFSEAVLIGGLGELMFDFFASTTCHCVSRQHLRLIHDTPGPNEAALLGGHE
jgi:pimeloyl-ACP methyl ester carboxylesterase